MMINKRNYRNWSNEEKQNKNGDLIHISHLIYETLLHLFHRTYENEEFRSAPFHIPELK
jgi:hypothetical protein